MPDWSYRTVFRQALALLPAETARGIALGFMGRLTRVPLGSKLIDFLGHLHPDSRLEISFLGLKLASPVGLGPYLDPPGGALSALARFGFGFAEVSVGPAQLSPATLREILFEKEAFCYSSQPQLPLQKWQAQSAELQRLTIPLFFRLYPSPASAPAIATAEIIEQLAALRSTAAGYTLGSLSLAVEAQWTVFAWQEHLHAVRHSAQKVAEANLTEAAPQPTNRLPLLLVIPSYLTSESALPYVAAAVQAGFDGFVVDGCVRTADQVLFVGQPGRATAELWVARLRDKFSADLALIAAGGIHAPEDAVAFLQRGANMVLVDTGLAIIGPGLVKRINDVILAERLSPQQPPGPQASLPEMAWFWAFLLGLAMCLGGLLALFLTVNRVLLPYDEHYLGNTYAELAKLHPRLVSFMAHDRGSLAGTMIALGVLYMGLAVGGIRRGLRWAKNAVGWSAISGFFGFFLFLGFGYFDPFHAFVTSVLLQLFFQMLSGKISPEEVIAAPNRVNSWKWKMSLYGQLLLIAHGVALMVAGATICYIGSTTVFVQEDLEFMQSTAEEIRQISPRLVPLVAHDRASFGAMLVSSGLALFLPGLWGYRQGHAWLAWLLLGGGSLAYVCTLIIHYQIGYQSGMHLAPAFAGLLVHWLAMALSWPYLTDSSGSSAIAKLQERRN